VNAGRHALGWLVAGNAAGLWLSLLLLFPELQAGEWTYGRWMPVHLNVQLFGWTALPLVGWLLSIYGVSRRWADAAVRAWSAALGAGLLSWLGGASSGKIFLDWKGGPLLAFVAALSFLWVVLALAWRRDARRWQPAKRWLSLAGLLLLAGVPWGMWLASSPNLYPPIDRSTGGPTGASLLGSTLVVVGLLMLLPRACGLAAKRPGLPWKTLGFFALSWIVFGIAESIGGTHSDALQIGALGLLLPWPWLVLRDWRGFRWPDKPHGWRLTTLLWWGLLVVTGFLAFLPDILDRLKFTHSLVAHSHLAMAGFTTSFCALLLRLSGNRFGNLGSAVVWNVAAFTMVVVLAAAGWAEGADVSWMADAPAWRTAALGARTLCGLAMLAASAHWFITWREHDRPEPSPDKNHETPRPVLESGRRCDGRADRPLADPVPGPGPAPAGDHGTTGGNAGLPELDRSLRRGDRPVLRSLVARSQRGGDGVGLHRDDPLVGRRLSHGEDRVRQPAGGLGDGGGGGRRGGDGPDGRPEGGLVEGPGLSLAWRAAGVVAMLYAHFLIFAQFAWVELMRGAGASALAEKIALGAMAAAGIAAGFLVARRNTRASVLQLSFLAAALSAALAPSASSMPFAIAISLVTGASIGTLSVGVATLLPRWCGIGWIGLGTGLGYALCNLPPVFLATPAHQAGIGAAFALAGALVVPRRTAAAPQPARPSPHGMLAVVAAFTALVWLDSAAFFIIQHERDLKSATWGEPMLWRNAAVHLAVALAAGLLLRHRFSAVLAAAWTILAIAAVAVNQPATRGLAGWWYPAGVSLYSTALVAWPGFFTPDPDPRAVARRAAWLFAVAGWFGSANGIGMVQSLQRVPTAFVAAAGLVVVGCLIFTRRRWPSAVALGGVLALAFAAPAPPKSGTPGAVERGRSVYLAEGCIHCHSRYVRPDSPDVALWGPASDPALVLAEKPVLIGNRRQGPDLANVGARRSAAWLKLHFLAPRDFAPDSPMPSYAHLFRDGRGDDLIAFLRELPAEVPQARAAAALAWTPAPAAAIPDGAPLYQRHCALCHGPVGHGDGKLAPLLSKAPAHLDRGPFLWTPAGPDLETRIARVIKHGIPGTDMPGHETLSDAQLVALARYVDYLRQD
jgi:cytochrome c oxidase cbb3-type subunit 2